MDRNPILLQLQLFRRDLLNIQKNQNLNLRIAQKEENHLDSQDP